MIRFLHVLSLGLTRLNVSVGKYVAWLALFMVLVQFAVVMLRYLFGYGSIFMQESVFYMHALLFILGAGYALAKDGHVRVDIFYQTMSPQRKAMVDLFGVLVFLLPFCVMLFIVAVPYVSQSWAVLEGSKETSGIPAVYLLKGSILLFCALVICQGMALAMASISTLLGQPVPKHSAEDAGQVTG